MDLSDLAQLRLDVQYVPISSLRAEELNPRKHSKRQISALARSISAFGFVTPMLVDAQNKLIAGHGRLLAAKKLELSQVPVVRLEHLDEPQVRALMIADNRLTDMSDWDDNLLAENFRMLSVEGINLDLESTGFAMGEIDLILDGPSLTSSDADDPDDAITDIVPLHPVNRVGDVWRLGTDGRHRLACGDARDPVIWKALMADQKAAISISDVPYNVKIRGNVSGLGRYKHGEFVMASGEMSREEFTDFLTTVFRQLVGHSQPASIHFSFIDWKHLGEMQEAGEAAFTELKNVIVWDKGRGLMGSMYRSAYELIFCWKSGRGKHRNNIELGRYGRNRTNIWRYPSIASFRHSDEGDLLSFHPTVKNCRMIADAMLDVSARGEIVVDAFLGSGTSIIAAERVGRRCFGLELDPSYADLCVRRFERHSGELAIHEPSGLNFGELVEQRAAENAVLAAENSHV